MRGLFKNNFYSAVESVPLSLGAFLVVGVALMFSGNPALLVIPMALSATVFAFNSVSGFKQGEAGKYHKFLLTTPVKRKDIIKCSFVSFACWSVVGEVLFDIVVAKIALLVNVILKYDYVRDEVMAACLGIGIALLFGAFFYPAGYFFGFDKGAVIFILSLIGAISAAVAISQGINAVLINEPLNQSGEYYLLMCGVFLGVVMGVFVLSYFLTVFIFKRKEY